MSRELTTIPSTAKAMTMVRTFTQVRKYGEAKDMVKLGKKNKDGSITRVVNTSAVATAVPAATPEPPAAYRPPRGAPSVRWQVVPHASKDVAGIAIGGTF